MSEFKKIRSSKNTKINIISEKIHKVKILSNPI